MYRYDADGLKCRRAHRASGDTPCWNHVQVSCTEICERVLPWLMNLCQQFAGFRDAMIDGAWTELDRQRRKDARKQKSVDDEIAELERRSLNLAQAIAKGGHLDALVQQLAQVDSNLKAARGRKAEQLQANSDVVPTGSRTDVEQHLEAVFRVLAQTSFEFGDLMRRVIPEFWIVPVQALDSGFVRPRARLIFRPSALLPGSSSAHDATPQPGDVTVTLDLFEPPLHIRAMSACLAARRDDPRKSLKKIEAETGYCYMTVKRALAYSKLMKAEGLIEPYRELTASPASASRWRQETTACQELVGAS